MNINDVLFKVIHANKLSVCFLMMMMFLDKVIQDKNKRVNEEVLYLNRMNVTASRKINII